MLIKQGSQQKTQSSLNSNKKCTRLTDCSCQMCHKESQIIEKLTLRENLEWFGKRRSLSQKNNSLREVELEFFKLTKQNQEKKNRKNDSQNFNRAKQILDCTSSYVSNYQKKQPQNTAICSPSDQLSLIKDNGNTFKTIYYDSFKSKDIKVEKQKPIKKLQIPMDLPFVGKSSYKDQFGGLSLTDRSFLQKPKDCIRTINVDVNKFQSSHEDSIRMNAKILQGCRPPSPIKNKGHMMKSNSYTFAYNTLYNSTFEKDKTSDIIVSEPNPEFLRRSKFGSLSKTRWMTKQKLQDLKRDESLQLYM